MKVQKLKRRQDKRATTTGKRLEQERRSLPSLDMYDPNFRRLKYVRYADDFILAFIGTKQEAEAIRDAIALVLREQLGWS